MWHKLEETRHTGPWTVINFLTYLDYTGRDCPVSVHPLRWRAMIRQLENHGEEVLLFNKPCVV